MNKTTIFIIAALVIILIIGAIYKMNPKSNNSTQVLLTTNQGEITIELYSDMPITTENFKKLVKQGTYNGVIFHRIISGFMIQGGDPTGTGMGDPSIPNIQDEFTHKGGNKNNCYTMNRSPSIKI